MSSNDPFVTIHTYANFSSDVFPQSILVYKHSDVYITDNTNVLKLIDSYVSANNTRGSSVITGQVSLDGGYADGSFDEAMFKSPSAMTLFEENMIFICDSDNHVVRSIDISGKVVQTIAGTAGKRGFVDDVDPLNSVFDSPNGVDYTSSGELIIADTYNNCIRILNFGTNQLSTLVGKCGENGDYSDSTSLNDAILHSPQSIVIDRSDTSNNILYFVDFGFNILRSIDLTRGTISLIAGKPNIWDYSNDGLLAVDAGFDQIQAIAIDRNFIYISDIGAGRIRYIHKESGRIFTIIGNGADGFSGDGENNALAAEINFVQYLATDSDVEATRLFLSDTNNNRIRVARLHNLANIPTMETTDTPKPTITPKSYEESNSVDVIDTFVKLEHPEAITLDPGRNKMYVGTDDHVIYSVDMDTHQSEAILGNSQKAGSSLGLLNFPSSLYFSSKYQSIFIADTNNHRIKRLDLNDDSLVVVAGTGRAGFTMADNNDPKACELSSPMGVTVDERNGDIYIADSNNNLIRKVSGSEGGIFKVAGTTVRGVMYDDNVSDPLNAVLSRPHQLSLFQNLLYFTDSGHNILRCLDLETQKLRRVAGKVNTYDNDGMGGLAIDASFDLIIGLSIDRQGNIYVSDAGGNRIMRIDASSTVITVVAGNGLGSYSGDKDLAIMSTLYNPRSLVMDSATGVLYIVDTYNDRIRKVYSVATTSAPSLVPSTTPSLLTTESPTFEDTFAPSEALSELPTFTLSSFPSSLPSSRLPSSIISNTPTSLYDELFDHVTTEDMYDVFQGTSIMVLAALVSCLLCIIASLCVRKRYYTQSSVKKYRKLTYDDTDADFEEDGLFEDFDGVEMQNTSERSISQFDNRDDGDDEIDEEGGFLQKEDYE